MSPATIEIRFVLDRITRIRELAADEKFSDASDDVVDAVLEGAGEFASCVWAPLNGIGDTVGARLTEDGVLMPDGYASAYQAYVEGGWGTIGVPVAHGGQGLPFMLRTAVLELLGTANIGFALCPTLTAGAIEALAHHGSTEQQARYLPHLATGAWTDTMNLTEPQAGSDVGALRAQALPRGNGTWPFKGTKIVISFGHSSTIGRGHQQRRRASGDRKGHQR